MKFLKWMKWLMPNRSLEQLEKNFQQASPIPTDYTSPYPHRETDPGLEFLSQPLDGERNPKVKEMTRELTGGLSERER